MLVKFGGGGGAKRTKEKFEISFKGEGAAEENTVNTRI